LFKRQVGLRATKHTLFTIRHLVIMLGGAALAYYLSGLVVYSLTLLLFLWAYQKNQRMTQQLKVAQTDLSSTRTHLGAITESIPLGVFRTAPNGDWETANQEWQTISRLSLSKSIGTGWHEAIAKPDLENLLREFEIAQFRSVGFSMEVRLNSAEPMVTWVLITVKPLLSELQTLQGFIGTVENKTQQKLTEEILYLSQRIDQLLRANLSYRDILNQSLALFGRSFNIEFAGAWMVDTQTRRLFLRDFWVNPVTPHEEFLNAQKNTTFLAGEELPGQVWQTESPKIISLRTISELHHEPNTSRSELLRQTHLHGGMAFPLIISGELVGVLEFLSSAKLIFSPAHLNELNGITIRIGHLLAQRQSENSLKELWHFHREQLQAVEKSSGLCMTDTDGTITYANDLFIDWSKTDRQEILGKNHEDFLTVHHHKQFISDLKATIEKGQTWHGELYLQLTVDVSLWVKATISPFKDHNGQITQFMAIYQDLSLLKQTQRQLEQASKMTALGELASGIAHEIYNPLAIIASKAQLIARALQKPTLDVAYIENSTQRIEMTVARISKIIRGLKTFSRDNSTDEFELYPLVQLITECTDMCGAHLQSAGINLRVDLPDPEYMVRCRPVQIEQVILNLITNARDAISCLAHKWIRVTFEVDKDFFKLKIIDSGHGIPHNVQEKLFTPFFTTKPAGKGTGLGLSISQNIVAQHGGQIYIDDLSVNTCFVLVFKYQQAQASRPAS
jgi:PAS domain S-box-containing protein